MTSLLPHLRSDGFCVLPQVVDAPLLAELKEATSDLLERDKVSRAYFPRHGSMVPVPYANTALAKLIACPGILSVLEEMGYETKWMSGYIISKPPQSPSLWWHQDWWAWDDPASGVEDAPQLFAMCYLQDTTIENGCLRVIPGSHRERMDIHDHLPEAHSHEANEADDDSPAHRPHPLEQNIEVQAGDVVLGDVRLLHGTYANTTDTERTCITLWYLPTFSRLSPALRKHMGNHHCLPAADATDVPAALQPLIPRFTGEAEAVVINRVPGTLMQAHAIQ